MKFEAPIEYRELDHTADVAIEVDGAVEEEVYARAALALGQMLAGGGPMTQLVERTLEPAGHDRVSQLVALLRDVLAQFYDERLILCAIDVRLGPPFAATCWFAKWDPAVHGEGVDVKAVTYGGARFEPSADGWTARLIFDI
ncbi:MAG: archease [Myxococcales bacterium]|nr:archease [Myxococcales bacterium]